MYHLQANDKKYYEIINFLYLYKGDFKEPNIVIINIL